MFGVHWAYIALLLVVVLIIFGPGRLPELGGAVGKAMREFRKATNEITSEVTNAAKPDTQRPAETAAAKGSSTSTSSTSEADSTKS